MRDISGKKKFIGGRPQTNVRKKEIWKQRDEVLERFYAILLTGAKVGDAVKATGYNAATLARWEKESEVRVKRA
jgi:hypothetical protein